MGRRRASARQASRPGTWMSCITPVLAGTLDCWERGVACARQSVRSRSAPSQASRAHHQSRARRGCAAGVCRAARVRIGLGILRKAPRCHAIQARRRAEIHDLLLRHLCEAWRWADAPSEAQLAGSACRRPQATAANGAILCLPCTALVPWLLWTSWGRAGCRQQVGPLRGPPRTAPCRGTQGAGSRLLRRRESGERVARLRHQTRLSGRAVDTAQHRRAEQEAAACCTPVATLLDPW
mmetsp:Transcript_96946/g.313025  ORF Transcript_96946/g.313025 Transcript_96946/m.313025 type:complete len:238 (+) Transcript_96946:116-829(+)